MPRHNDRLADAIITARDETAKALRKELQPKLNALARKAMGVLDRALEVSLTTDSASTRIDPGVLKAAELSAKLAGLIVDQVEQTSASKPIEERKEDEVRAAYAAYKSRKQKAVAP